MSPSLVLILGLLACAAGGSVAKADDLPYTLGAMTPGWTLILISLVMYYRQSRAKRIARDEADRDIADES